MLRLLALIQFQIGSLFLNNSNIGLIVVISIMAISAMFAQIAINPIKNSLGSLQGCYKNGEAGVVDALSNLRMESPSASHKIHQYPGVPHHPAW